MGLLFLNCFGHAMWGLSSPTRGRTHAPCTGSLESELLDRQGSPSWDSERRPSLSSVLEAGRQPHSIVLSEVLGLPSSRLEGCDGVGGGGLELVTLRAFAPSDGSSDEWQ